MSLTLGGVNKLAGVYGSSNSPATYQDARFSGTGTVTVPVPVSIANLPATGIATNQATLDANLGLNLAYGGTNATVLAYWGTADGGTNPAAWANSAYVGKWANVLSTNISFTATGLAMNTNTTYYFAFMATNAVYTVWATNVLSFTLPTKLAFTSVPVYPPAGYPFSVTVQAQDPNGNPQAVTSATTVQLSKSSGSGTLSGTASGTIVNGSSSVVISGAAYWAADTMTLTATAVSGMGLGAAVSPPITFMPPDLTWDANGSGAAVRDGGGVWLNTTNTWWNGATNLNWADNYNARIGAGGAGGIITLDTVTANRVTFTNFSGTYTLVGGTLNVMSNLTVASSSGSVVLTYIIGGPGAVTMDSSGLIAHLRPEPQHLQRWHDHPPRDADLGHHGQWDQSRLQLCPGHRARHAQQRGDAAIREGHCDQCLDPEWRHVPFRQRLGCHMDGACHRELEYHPASGLQTGDQRQHQRRGRLHQDGRQHGNLLRHEHLHRGQCGAGRHAVLLEVGFIGLRRPGHQQWCGG